MIVFLAVTGVVVMLSTGIVYLRGGNRGGVITLPFGRCRRLRVRAAFLLWVAIFVICVLFGGLRYYVGTDYKAYIEIFTGINSYYDYAPSVEIGYVWLNRLVGCFTRDPQAIMYITSAVIVFFYLMRIRKSSLFIPFSIYVFMNLFSSSFNTVRQGMAIAISFFAMEYAKEHKWVRLLAMMAMAVLFHKTALFMVVLFILCSREYPLPAHGAATVGVGLVFLVREPLYAFLMHTFYPNYNGLTEFEYNPSFSVSPVQVFLCIIYLVLCVIYYRPLLKQNPGNVLFINISYVFLLFNLFMTWTPFWERMILYFQAMFAQIVPELIGCEGGKWTRRLYYFIIWGVMLLFWVVALRGAQYQTIFNKGAYTG